jgi:hypothetical protein
LARRKLPPAPREYAIWDTELAGFGLRIRPSGRRSWFVRRRRGKHQRVTLGAVEDLDAPTARMQARRILAVVLDGLPAGLRSVSRPPSPSMSMSSGAIARITGSHRPRSATGMLSASTLLRSLARCGSTSSAGRTSSAGGTIARRKQAKFNRALPVLAAMLKYAEALGYLRKGSNPAGEHRASSERRWSGFSVRRSIGGGWRWTKPKKPIPRRSQPSAAALHWRAVAGNRRPAMGLGAGAAFAAARQQDRPQDDLAVQSGGADLGIPSAPRRLSLRVPT